MQEISLVQGNVLELTPFYIPLEFSDLSLEDLDDSFVSKLQKEFINV